MTPVRVFRDEGELGAALAAEIIAGIDEARASGRRYVLGCPGGRSGRSTYQALAQGVRGADISHLVIAMMDDYVLPTTDGAFEHCPADAHYSCRRFARVEIVGPLNAAAAVGVPDDQVWLPDPPRSSRPTARGSRTPAGSTSSSSRAVPATGTSRSSSRAPRSTVTSRSSRWQRPRRRDNMATFPEFGSLDDVPRYGVSVGLGTIVVRLARGATDHPRRRQTHGGPPGAGGRRLRTRLARHVHPPLPRCSNLARRSRPPERYVGGRPGPPGRRGYGGQE